MTRRRQLGAALHKNLLLKSRGNVLCWSVLEVVVPAILFLLMWIPRAVLPTESLAADARFDRYPLGDLRWATHLLGPDEDGLLEKGNPLHGCPRGGGWQVLWAPDVSAAHAEVARNALLSLACKPPSVLMQLLQLCGRNENEVPDLGPSFYPGGSCFALFGTMDEASCLASTESSNCVDTLVSAMARGFGSEARATEYAAAEPHKVAGLVVLHDDISGVSDLKVTIRVNQSDVPDLGSSFARWVSGPESGVDIEWRAWKTYWMFVNLQRAFSQSLVAWATDTPELSLDIDVQPWPWRAYEYSLGSLFAGGILKFILPFAYLSTAILIMKTIVMEKEARIAEGMFIVGLRRDVYWLSWFVVHISTLVFVAVVLSLLGLYPFPNTQWGVQLVTLVTFSVALTLFLYALSVFFNRARIAAIGGSLLFVLSVAPAVLAQLVSPDGSWTWTFACVLPPSGLYMWGEAIIQREVREQGITFSNLFESVDINGTFSAGGVLIMLAVDVFFWALCFWYLAQAYPQRISQHEKWYFPASPRYWRRTLGLKGREKATEAGLEGMATQAAVGHGLGDGGEKNAEAFDPLIEPIRGGASKDLFVDIRGLVKVYGNSCQACTKRRAKPAVDGLSVQFERGKIGALLGHNGAGKTSTIAVLTGMLRASDGHASILGMDVATEMGAIRQDLGVCPQHDILWPQLTVGEHLRLFCAFHGVRKNWIDSEVWARAEDVELSEKLDKPVSTLSGGQRRKLSAAMAFIGNPRAVILDEPTSSLDPHARTQLWALIKSMVRNAGCSVLLISHYMDECEAICDRIAIMHQGKLGCVGSPTFLKSRLGKGYDLTVLLDQRQNPKSHGSGIEALVLKYVPSATLMSRAGLERSFALPGKCSAAFPDMLDELEANRDAMGVATYSITSSTIEEVFINMAVQAEQAERGGQWEGQVGNSDAAAEQPEIGHSGAKRLSGWRLRACQLRALFVKRFHNSRRDKLALVAQLLIPVMFVLAALLIAKVGEGMNDPDPTPMVRAKSLSDVPATILESQLNNSAVSSVWGYNMPGGKYLPVDAGTSAEDLQDYLLSVSTPLHSCNQFDPTSCDAAYAGTYSEADASYATLLMPSQTAFHALPTGINTLVQALYRTLAANPDASFTAFNWPLPRPQGDNPVIIADIMLALCLVMGSAVLSSAHSAFPVAERASKSKHVQVVSGARRVDIWLATYAWDFLAYLVPATLIFVCMVLFDLDFLEPGGSLGAAALLLLGFGLSALPLAYAFSFAFDSDVGSLAGQAVTYLILGLAFVFVSVILDALESPLEPGVRDAFEALQWFFRCLPHFSLSYGIYAISADARLAPDLRVGALSMGPDGAGWCIVYLFLTAPIYLALCLLIEYWSEAKAACLRMVRMHSRKTRGHAARVRYLEGLPKTQEDPDVYDERLRVEDKVRLIVNPVDPVNPNDEDEETGLRDTSRDAPASTSTGNSEDAVLLSGVTKVFGKAPRAWCQRPSSRAKSQFTAAVSDLSFGVAHGTAFGFCGINGAGKTTGFRILTAEIPPTCGQVYVRDFASTQSGAPPYLRLDRDAARIRQNLGYCPQSDPLVGTMTGVEHLHLYASLRGVRSGRPREAEVQRLVTGLVMQSYIGRPSAGYSGGQKRALSVAIALVGRTPLVLMDEPSSGMDPLASRRLWNSLTDLIVSNNSPGDGAERDGPPMAPALLLTSHSMLESEALCGRIGIMIGGRLRCLGSPQHLKDRFGSGYVLELKVCDGIEGGLVADAVRSRLAGARVLEDSSATDACGGIVRVALGRDRTLLPEAFKVARSVPGVTDFVVAQSSLDEVFDALARQSLNGTTPSESR